MMTNKNLQQTVRKSATFISNAPELFVGRAQPTSWISLWPDSLGREELGEKMGWETRRVDEKE